MDAYQEAVAFTLLREGGYYDGKSPGDPHPTNYGVTQETYDDYRTSKGFAPRPVKEIEAHEVADIYRTYWVAGLPRLTSITVFDHSLNAGPKHAIQALQRALGVTDDGIFGPVTRAAVANLDDAVLAERVCWERLRYYVDLAKLEKYRPDLLSWTHRVVKYRETYLN